MLGEYRSKEAVTADPGPPVADADHLFSIDGLHVLPVDDEDEIVLGAVSLGERLSPHAGHPPMPGSSVRAAWTRSGRS